MKPIKVLMVDDEAQFRETTAKLLKRKGFETTIAGTGEESLDVLARNPQDVVVLDVRMPGIDGHETLQRIKEIDPNIQVIMLTGHGQMESAKTALKHQAFDYLAKPCDVDRLAARITDAYTVGHPGKRPESTARDVMIPLQEYTTIGPDDSVREGIARLRDSFEELIATEKLMQTGHRSLLVMEGGRLAGVLSIVDLMAGLRPGYLSAPRPSTADQIEYSAMFWTGLFTTQAKVLAGKKVREVMSDPPPAVNEEANLMEIANLLYETESRRLAVYSGDRVAGVVREQEVFFELARLILNV